MGLGAMRERGLRSCVGRRSALRVAPVTETLVSMTAGLTRPRASAVSRSIRDIPCSLSWSRGGERDWRRLMMTSEVGGRSTNTDA